MLLVSVSVYVVDTFTAIQLLAFNRWVGRVQPKVDLRYSRWIFVGCISLSFALLCYRWYRALGVMSTDRVAQVYLDPLAVRVECVKVRRHSRGWKRFLVFAELTKSRKGADYVALFAYYSFDAWFRVVVVEGPRVVINGITLYAYACTHLAPSSVDSVNSGASPFIQFWSRIDSLAEQDRLQITVVCGMLWTCSVWAISVLRLIVAIVLYLIFLWQHIPDQAGGLSGYCRTKVNRRMNHIVKMKAAEALEKENELQFRRDEEARRLGKTPPVRQPTLPDLQVHLAQRPCPGVSEVRPLRTRTAVLCSDDQRSRMSRIAKRFSYRSGSPTTRESPEEIAVYRV